MYFYYKSIILLRLGIDIVSSSIINALESRISRHDFYVIVRQNGIIFDVNVFILEFILCIFFMNIR